VVRTEAAIAAEVVVGIEVVVEKEEEGVLLLWMVWFL
jgi:hypothetical protein